MVQVHLTIIYLFTLHMGMGSIDLLSTSDPIYIHPKVYL